MTVDRPTIIARMMDRFLGFAILVLVPILMVGFLIAGACLQFAKHVDHQNCPHREEAWNLPTKFVSYSAWDWDCLVQVNNKWIPVDRYNGVELNK